MATVEGAGGPSYAMATVEGAGERGRGGGRGGWRERAGGRGRGVWRERHGGRGDDRARPPNPTGHAAAGNDASGGGVDDRAGSPSLTKHAAAGNTASGGGGDDRARLPNPIGHAVAGNAASGVPQVATASWPPSEGPGARSPEQRHTPDGDAQYDDVDLEKMKKYVQELVVKNAELKQKLEAAQAQLEEGNRYINADPLIDGELRKCHDVFLCLDESHYKKLSEFLSDPQSKLTMDVKVKGRKVTQALKRHEKDLQLYTPPGARAGSEKPKKLRRMTTVAKYVILGIIEDIYRLHRHGLSLNGQFKLDNFFWTHLKKVKLDPALKLVVCKRERYEMINDFHQIYQIILDMLAFHDSGLPVPDDLQCLLDLLKSDDPVKHHQIIRYNMSLLSEIGKKCHFITLYERLQQQIREDAKKGLGEEKKSEKVLQFMSTHFSYPGNGKEPWSNMAQDNAYVGAVYDLRSAYKNKVLEEPLDLLIVWRNALSHILETSVEGGVPLFKDEDLVNMLESTIPGVFNGLQRAMSEVGLLELPHLMRAMRM